jgi:ribosomal small subunit protein bTHX
MGKGDRRTRKGKIFAGSFGKARPKTKNKVAKAVVTTEATETVETKTEEKAEA